MSKAEIAYTSGDETPLTADTTPANFSLEGLREMVRLWQPGYSAHDAAAQAADETEAIITAALYEEGNK